MTQVNLKTFGHCYATADMNPEKSNTLKSMGNTAINVWNADMKKDEIGISKKKYDRLFQKSEAIRLPHYFSSSIAAFVFRLAKGVSYKT